MVGRVEPATFQNIEEEKARFASARVNVAAGGTEQFVVNSPSGSDVKANILSLSFRSGAEFTVDYKEGFSIDTAGTEMNVANAKTSGSDSTSLTFEYGGSYSGGSVIAESLIPGSSANKGGGTSVENIELIVANNDELMFEVENQNSSNSAFISVIFFFIEESL